jgi:adhesin transport system outer membrane protein
VLASAISIGALIALAEAAAAMSLREAVERAVRTNPSVTAAQASRRATTYELRQAQGRLLPQLSLEGDVGREKIDRPLSFAPDVNDVWRNRRQVAVTARQSIFDGLDRANDIYRQAARVDAAAWRVMARAEAIGLDTVEAYIDIMRQQDVLEVSRQSVQRHREILQTVRSLERGGRVPRSEVLQVEERLDGATSAVTRVQQSLAEARARFVRLVGATPAGRLQPVSSPSGIPMSREQALLLGPEANPAVAAADADAEAAKRQLDQSRSVFFPQVTLEGRAVTGEEVNGTPGPNRELMGRVVVTWTLFDGLINVNRHRELAERWGQAMAERDERLIAVREELERALAARTSNQQRVEIQRRQVATARRIVVAYEEEYRGGKRSLLDLLDAESSRFNEQIQLISSEAIVTFSGYRILASMGRLLASLRVEPPSEASAVQRELTQTRGPFATDLPPLR